MATAFSYQRFSTKIQAKGDSLRRQLEAAQNYCDEKGLTLSNSTFQDLGVSAFSGANTLEDAGLGQFISACEKGLIPKGSYLLVESLDRLSRKKLFAALAQFLSIIEYGINIVTLINQNVYGEGIESRDLILSLFDMERAYQESAIKSHRISMAWANKRKNPNTAKKIKNCPFWLKVNQNKNTFEVIEQQATLVREIFSMSIEGFGVYKIVNILNERGIKAPKGGDWATTSINRILSEKQILGEYQPHIRENGKRVPIGDAIPNYYPAIIGQDTFHLSSSRRKGRYVARIGRRGTTFSNLFINVAYCKKCSARMVYKDKGNDLRYLTCSNRVKKLCDNKPARYELFNEFIRQVYLTPQFYKSVIELVPVSANTQEESLEVLESRLDSANKGLNAVMESIGESTNSVIKEQIASRVSTIDKLKDQISNYQQRNAEVNSSSVHQSFNQGFELVRSCFNTSRSNEELFSDRAKLNRVLIKGLKNMTIFNDKGDVYVEVNGWKFHYLQKRWCILKPI